MKSLFKTGFQVDSFRPVSTSRRLGQEIITSIDQGPPAEPVPGAITTLGPSVPTTQPAGTSDTDWAKTLNQALQAASQGYGTYTKEEIARLNKQAADLKAKNPTVAPLMPAAQPSVLPYVLVGMGALGLMGLFLALKSK